ncbi:Prophage CP4-57 regulatory protein (AlpA) [Prochlorococcus sp. MIT 1306]|nr:Prophage CP4-57 regulatory protein (AlpA) [Prochlorococcus sp. MIT 1306]
MGQTFIYARMNEGTLPVQIKLGPPSAAWNEPEITKWVKVRCKPMHQKDWELISIELSLSIAAKCSDLLCTF